MGSVTALLAMTNSLSEFFDRFNHMLGAALMEELWRDIGGEG